MTLDTNTLNVSLTIALMVNGVATALTVTYLAGETGTRTMDAIVSFSVGDGLSWSINRTGGAGGHTGGGTAELYWT